MILKKPYALLIKHFRLIHLILGLLLCAIAYISLDVVEFFNTYVRNGYNIGNTQGLAAEYTPLILFIIVFVVLAMLITLLVLMKHKKKPSKFYFFSIIYYIAVFVGLFILSGILDGFETALLESKVARSVRDILVLSYIPQFIFIAGAFIRAIGFNIKKFDFQNDIREMGLNATDAEEVEININVDFDKIGRNVNKSFRETKYYLKENKFIMFCLCIVFVGVSGYFIYKAVTSDYDKVVGMNKIFTFERVEFKVNDVIVTNIDYQGKELDNDKYYVVLDLYSKNTSSKSVKMDYNNFKLRVGDSYYTPDLSRNGSFVDYLPGNVLTLLTPNRENEFALVYVIDGEDKAKSMKLSIYNGTVYYNNKTEDKFIYVNLKKDILDSPKLSGNFNVNDEVKFGDTYLKDTSLTIKSYKIYDRYDYSYKSCKDNGKCTEYKDRIVVSLKNNRQNNKIMIIKTDYNQDSETKYASSYSGVKSFTENFAHIEYKVGENTYKEKAINVTPDNASGFIAFEVPKNIEEASIIQLTIVIRNKTYFINLK